MTKQHIVYKCIKTPTARKYFDVLNFMKTLGWENTDMRRWELHGSDTEIIVGNPVMQCGKGPSKPKYQMAKQYVTLGELKAGVEKLKNKR